VARFGAECQAKALASQELQPRAEMRHEPVFIGIRHEGAKISKERLASNYAVWYTSLHNPAGPNAQDSAAPSAFR